MFEPSVKSENKVQQPGSPKKDTPVADSRLPGLVATTQNGLSTAAPGLAVQSTPLPVVPSTSTPASANQVLNLMGTQPLPLPVGHVLMTADGPIWVQGIAPTSAPSFRTI
jgi:hypothetical protein